MSFRDRLMHSWNAFMNRDPTPTRSYGPSYSYTYRPDRPRLTTKNERSLMNAAINKIAIDAAQIDIKHVKLDIAGRYVETIDSGLNSCLNLEANTDQTGRAFRQDIFQSLLDEGSIAIIPVETSIDPKESGSYRIDSMRVGKVTEWFPKHVRVKAYNELTGRRDEVILPKSQVSIVENPFYTIMNEPNSTLQRLIRKLNLLDVIDEQSGSGKLDLIIQLPYTIKTEARRAQAEQRRKDIETQLANNKFGIAYTDATEHVTQLNRSVENNLMKQIEYLTTLFYSQLGITQEILNGTADANAMNNYYNRTIEPMVSAVVDEMKRKFLTKTARTQLQSIKYFRDPFKLVSVSDLAELADKFTRNEIMTANEIRQVVGLQPSTDPKADELRNSNLSEPNADMPVENDMTDDETGDYETEDY